MHVLHFASQPASFNQVHQTLVQLAIMQGNQITMGEKDNQPNIWLHTHQRTREAHAHRQPTWNLARTHIQTHIRGHI